MSGKITFNQELITDPANWYMAVNYGVKVFKAEDYKLTISGDVDNPIEYSYADLKGMDQIKRSATKTCLVNGNGGNMIFNVEYTGVDLLPILESAGVKEGANAVKFTGYDGWVWSEPLSAVIESKAFLILQADGKDLEAGHGFPVTVAVPGRGGAVWVKYLKSIEISTAEEGQIPGDGGMVVSVNAGFLVPAKDGMEFGSPVHIEGWAYTQFLGSITTLLLSADYGKTWNEYPIPEGMDPAQWVYWKIDWTPPGPGHYLLKVKAQAGEVVQAKEANVVFIVK